MRALVTGGAGFIASNVVDALLDAGHEVTALDNFDPYYDPARKWRNVRAAQKVGPRYRIVEGSVVDAETVDSLFEQVAPQLVIHLAAKAGVRPSVEDPKSYLLTNELGGLHVLDACRRFGNVPLCYASTSSVYGATEVIPFDEADRADQPLSPYAASKRSGELMAYTYHQLHGLPVAVLRFFTVYGERGRPDMAVALFTEKLLKGEIIKLRGAETARDFTYVGDIVQGVLGAARWVQQEGGFGTFNLGRSEPVLVSELIDQLAQRFNANAKVELTELAPGESPVTAARVDRAAAAFGYAPKVSLAEGLDHWVRWYHDDVRA